MLRYKSVFARAALLGTVLLCGAIPTSACTFILDHDKVQCSTDSDCSIAARGPEFEGNVCKDSVCVRSATYCNSNAQCIDANGGSESFICNKETHGCVSLNYKNYCVDLHANRGDLRNDDAILVGFHWGSGLDEELKLGEVALDLARQDFASTTRGVPQAGGPGRPLVIISCNYPPSEIESPDVGREMTDFLLDTVGVKVMVGPLLDQDILYALDKANQKDAYLFTVRSLYETAAAVPGQAQHGLFVNLDTTSTFRAYARLIALHEKAMRAQGLPAATKVKVAMVTSTDATEADEIPGFLKVAQFNEVDGNANQAAGNFKYVQYGADGVGNEDPQFQTALSTLNSYQPDIIACRGVTCLGVLGALEKAKPTTYRWVLPGEQIQNLDFTPYTPTDADRSRFFATGAARPDNDPRWTDFANFYLEPKLNQDLQITKLAGLMYDIGYMLELGITAVGSKPLTGTAFHDALFNQFKVPGDTPNIIAGPTQIQAMTTNTLLAGQVLNAGGAELDFEISDKGTLANPPADVGCIGGSNAPKPFRMQSSGLTYNVREDKIVGTNTLCP